MKKLALSSRLGNVASGLKKLINKEEILKEDLELFDWAGKLLGQIDWDSGPYNSGQCKDLSVIATMLRPEFYKALIGCDIPPDPDRSERLYSYLTSYGKENPLKDDLVQAYKIFSSIAKDVLSEFQEINIGEI